MSLNSLDANTPDKYDIPPYCVLTRITFGRPLLGVLPVIVPFHYAVQYEKFVQSSRVLLYLERVYSRWFDRWGTGIRPNSPQLRQETTENCAYCLNLNQVPLLTVIFVQELFSLYHES